MYQDQKQHGKAKIRKPRFSRLTENKENAKKEAGYVCNIGVEPKFFQRKKSQKKPLNKRIDTEQKGKDNSLSPNCEKKSLMKGYVGKNFTDQVKEKLQVQKLVKVNLRHSDAEEKEKMIIRKEVKSEREKKRNFQLTGNREGDKKQMELLKKSNEILRKKQQQLLLSNKNLLEENCTLLKKIQILQGQIKKKNKQIQIFKRRVEESNSKIEYLKEVNCQLEQICIQVNQKLTESSYQKQSETAQQLEQFLRREEIAQQMEILKEQVRKLREREKYHEIQCLVKKKIEQELDHQKRLNAQLSIKNHQLLQKVYTIERKAKKSETALKKMVSTDDSLSFSIET